MRRQKFEKAIKDAIAKHAAATPSDRERVYRAARASLGRNPALTRDYLADLEAAIAAIEASYAASGRTPDVSGRGKQQPTARPKAWRTPVLALLAGIVLGAGASTYIQADAAAPAGQEAEGLEQLRLAYRSNVSHLPEATAFIRRVTDEIVQRQKTNKSSLEESAKGFIPLAKLDPALAGQMPKSLPAGTAILVRANATDLKVLMNWTLCGVASITNPELVDRKRAPSPAIGCPYFGLWTNGAADW